MERIAVGVRYGSVVTNSPEGSKCRPDFAREAAGKSGRRGCRNRADRGAEAEIPSPSSIPFPKDNPYTDAKADLGQALFFDPRLSGANTTSCASCHNPALGWKDGLGHG